MIGLIYIIFFLLYFSVINVVVVAVEEDARRWGKNAKIRGNIARIIMLSFVFWDVIPVYGLYGYKCAAESGYTAYKTIDEWKRENPGIAEKLSLIKNSDQTKINTTTRYQLSPRFAENTTVDQVWYILHKRKVQIVDVKTSDVMAEYVNFYTKLINPFVRPADELKDYKIWMSIGQCKLNFGNYRYKEFSEFRSKIKNIGDKS